jgi:hypothetical protein
MEAQDSYENVELAKPKFLIEYFTDMNPHSKRLYRELENTGKNCLPKKIECRNLVKLPLWLHFSLL